ncbi:hypothetical protein E0Z10_g10436 [Xylaria hypoxylon]|uniref:F-box domain-containing protein n=1 Tax=Xylaria hypoxylon TaxID=37992 RepID=A0A4Z0YL10_9PEZI|nr:hypothetical protein E0Z10_g10436 [Xylaria hypoxylon]
MKYNLRQTCLNHEFNHTNPISTNPENPTGTLNPGSMFRGAANKFRTSSCCQRLNEAVYRLTHGRKRSPLREHGRFGASYIRLASETSLGENPMIHYLPTSEECKAFAEGRRRIRARMNAASLAPRTTSKPKSRSLDDLPPEILIKIWKYVAETPSWFHVRYGSRQIYPVTINTNREHWVNKRWYFAAEFRRSLSQHPIQDNMRRYAEKVLHTTFLFKYTYRNGVAGPLVQTTADAAYSMLEWSRADTGCKPFKIRLQGVDRFPIVRPAVDWFFFENYVGALAAKAFNVADMQHASHMLRVSTVVLKLEDVYRGICLSLNGRSDRRAREPWRVDRSSVVKYIRRMTLVFGTLAEYTAQLEKCVILVGELRRGVQPSDLQEISVEWACPENESPSIDTQREITTFPRVSPNDRAMIRFVHQELEYFAKLQREWQNDMLRSPDGQVWLADIGHEKGSMRSEWLASTEGRIWRETTEEGEAWLGTASGHWWLASILGSRWLETPQGLDWLDSEAGVVFLRSPMARAWASVDNGEGDGTQTRGRVETRRKLPRKKWFDTGRGRAWVAENCPDYRVPAAPEPPRSEDAGNSASELPGHPALFRVRPPPHWGFVMVPAKVENCPRVKTVKAM